MGIRKPICNFPVGLTTSKLASTFEIEKDETVLGKRWGASVIVHLGMECPLHLQSAYRSPHSEVSADLEGAHPGTIALQLVAPYALRRPGTVSVFAAVKAFRSCTPVEDNDLWLIVQSDHRRFL